MSAFTPEVTALLKRIYSSANGYYDSKNRRHAYYIPNTVTTAELDLLDKAGCSPNRFVTFAHDDAVAALRDHALKIDLTRAADAFVASMTSADLAWRAVLPALALGLAIPTHSDDDKMGGDKDICRTCFHRSEERDATHYAFFRSEGSGWDDTLSGPIGALLTLQAALSAENWPKPTARDIWVFHQILALLRTLPPETRYSKARTALKSAKLLPRNEVYVCGSLLEAMAYVSLLQAPDHPGLFTRYTTTAERDHRPNDRTEVPAPLAWWSAANGVNETMVHRLFGHLTCPDEEPPSPKNVKIKIPKPKTTQVRSIPGSVAAGDVYAVRIREDVWGAVYCHEITEAPLGVGSVSGRIEWLDILSPTPPTAEQIQGLSFRDRTITGKRWQCWCSGLGKTTGVKRIAVDIPSPSHMQPQEDLISRNGARLLGGLAHWHFPSLKGRE